MPNLSHPRPRRRGVELLKSRKNIASAGLTAGVWTLSGVVLAACSSTLEDIEEFLGLDDSAGGGRVLHVQRSSVQGARLYFDMNNDGVIDASDAAAQDAVFPQGFVTDSTGRAGDIPAVFQDLPFKAVLDGAIDAETGIPLSGALHSIPDANANGYHRLASPITDLIARDSKTPEEVVGALLPNADSAEITRILELINNPRSYLGGHDGVEGFAFFLAAETAAGHTPTPTDSAVQSKAAQYLTDNPTDPNRDTLIVVHEDTDADSAFIDLPAKTIGVHDSYVATIQAVSHAGAVGYRFVDAHGRGTTISDFSINARGVIAFVGQNPTTATLHIEVSNGDASESAIVRVAVTVADAPTLGARAAGDAVGTIMENVAGAAGTGTALISGITASAGITASDFVIREANPAGMRDILSKFDVVSGSGNAFNLVLRSGESLDYDAISGGVLHVHVWAEENGIRSNALALRIQVEADPNEVGFSGSFTGIVAEDGNLVARGTISVENQPENEHVTISSQGTYGTLEYTDAGWTYRLDDSIARVDGLLTGQVLIDTATISVGGISQSIVIRINGADEDVHFVNDAGTRTTTASVDVEFGNPVLSGVDIFDGLTLTNANLADIEIDFAETGGNDDVFTISDTGLLTFTGTNADVAGLGSGITLNLQITAPTVTTATLPFALQVNVINAVDDGDADYEIVGDIIAGETLEVRRISADPDGAGAVSIAWYRGDASTPTGDRGTTYRVSAADEGETIGAIITYIDGANTSERIDITASSVAFASGMGSRSIDVDEGTIATSTTLAAVSAASKLGEAVSYAIGTSGDSALFSVDSHGAISLLSAGAWDYESAKQEYVIEVIASAADGAGGTDTARARITFAVQDVNEHAPVFDTTDTPAPIPENAGRGTLVARVRALDADGTAAHNTVRYDITAGDANGVFRIDSNGVITVNAPLDFDTTPSYTLEITASDGSLMATEMVAIRLTDVNDIVPMVEVTSADGRVRTTGRDDASGHAAAGTGYRITITDADTNNAFADNFVIHDDRFAFVETSAGSGVWELTVKAGQAVTEAEGDSITLTYSVGDGFNELPERTITLEVVDTPVRFTPIADPTDLVADENDAHWQLQLTAQSDAGGGDTSPIDTYEFVDGSSTAPASGIFRIDDNGRITITRAFDYETDATSHRLTVRATDSRVPSEDADITFTVTVVDANDVVPDLSAATTTATIAENVVGADAEDIRLTIDDADADATNHFTANRFTITEGIGTSPATAEKFAIARDGDNWNLRLISGMSLDYESDGDAGTIRLNVKVNDGAADSNIVPITITLTDINDNAPRVSGDSGAGTVRLIEAGAASTDTDTGYFITLADDDTDAVNRHEFTILGGEASRFAFVKASTTPNQWNLVLRAGQTVDREADGASVALNFQVTDGNNRPLTALSTTVAITDANDHAPTVAVTGTGALDERIASNTGAISATGLTITIADADATDAHKSGVDLTPNFRVLNADNTENTDFEVVDDGNGNWVLQLKAGSVLNREAPTAIIALKIEVSDGVNAATMSDAFTLSVNNLDEGDATYLITGDTMNNGMLSVALDTANPDPDGLVVGSETYRWFILNTDGTIPAVADTNGNIGDAARLTLPADVGNHVYGVIVTYRDNAGETEAATVIASPLRFASSAVEGRIVENSAETVVAATVTATLSTNASVVPTYTLNDDSGKFAISTSGEITLKSTATLDFENTPTITGTTNKGYVVTVDASATDGGKTENAPRASVTIIVEDANDSAPSITATDDARMATGALVDDRMDDDPGVSFKITDADSNGANRFDSDITSTTHPSLEGRFTLTFDTTDPSAKTAKLALKPGMKIDREELGNTDTISLNVKVTDGQATSAQGVDVTLTITDVNDSPPRVAGDSGAETARLIEAGAASINTDTGYFITLADDDTDAVNQHEFTILGSEASRFAFVEDDTTANQWNLVLLDGQTVDREADRASIALNFQVTDENNRPLTALSTTVAIIDANDHAPSIRAFPTNRTPPIRPITLNERPDADTSRAPIVVEGLTIALDDADATTAHQSITPTSTPAPTFTLLNAADSAVNEKFKVVHDNGNWVLQYVDSVLDAIATPSFEVIIQVSDGVHSPPAKSDPITLSVINVDEGVASFEVSPTQANENILEVEVATADPDGLNGIYSFQWFTTTDNGMTQSDIAGANDREFDTTDRTDPTGTVYGVRVEYIDHADTIYSEANGNAPFAVNMTLRFTESYAITLNDGNASPTLPTFAVELNGVAVTDASYAFATDGNPGAFFDLTSAGVLTLKAAVDFDTATAAEKSFHLLIVATAAGDETDMAMIPVTLDDANDNAPSITAADDTREATGALVDDVVDSDPGVSFKITDADSNAVNRFYSDITSTTHPSLEGRFTLTFDTTDPSAKTAKLALKSGMKIDREELGNTDTISLNVKVTDSQATSTQGVDVTLTITDVNDSAPTMTTSGTATLTEEVLGGTGGTQTSLSITLADKDSDAANQHAISIDDATLANRFAFVKDGTTANQWNLVLLEGQKVDRETDGTDGVLSVGYKISDGDETINAPITGTADVSIIDTNDNGPTMTLRGDAVINERRASDTDPIVAGITITIADADATDAHKSSVSGGPRPTFTVYDADGTTVNNDYAVVRKRGGAFHEYQLQHTGDVLDALTTSSVSLNIGVTDNQASSPDPDLLPVTLSVNNLDEGRARYEVLGVVGKDAPLTAMLVVGGTDPDGIDHAVATMYRWFRKASGDADPASFADVETASFKWLAAASTADRYTIDGMPVAGAAYGVLVSYKDGSVGDTLTFVPALAPALEIAASSYSGSINEDGTRLSVLDIDATVEGAATNISYTFVTDAATGTTAATHLGFAINSAGVISFAGPATDIDYDTNPVTDAINLSVRAIYDNGNSAIPNPFKDVDVAISVGATNDNAPTMTLRGDAVIKERLASDTDPIVAGITITIADADITAAHDSSVSGGPRPTFTVYDEDGTTVNNDYAVVRKRGGAVNEYQLQHTGDVLDASATSFVSLNIGVTDGVNASPELLPVTLSVINVDEGDATYAITGAVVGLGTLSVAVDTADPDGLQTGSETYRWFILNADDSIPAENEPNGNIGAAASLALASDVGTNIYGVVVTYMDHAGEMEKATAIVSFVRFDRSAVSMRFDENPSDTTATLASVSATLSTDRAVVPTYRLTDSANGKFVINAMGAISLASGETLDFETAPTISGTTDRGYVLLVDASASDNGDTRNAPPASVTIIVEDLNDNDPSITATDNALTATGVLLDDVVDDDPGVSFKIMDADSNAENTFGSDITSTTHASLEGRFTLIFDTTDPMAKTAKLALKPDMKIDREELGNTDTISLNVKVKDGQATSAQGVVVTLTITDVNDNAPAVMVDANNNRGALTEEVAGAAGDGTGTGYIITIADADTNNRFTFDMMDGEADRFAFVHDAQADRWELTLIAGAKVDYETDTETLTIRYRVNDGVNDALAIESAPITITDSNDHAPTLTMMGVGVLDEQVSPTHGPIETGITFTLNDVDVSADNPTPVFTVNDSDFEVVAVNGVWTLRLKADAELDYERAATIGGLRVTVDDGENAPPYQTAAGAIVLTVINVDDGPAIYAIDPASSATGGHRLALRLQTPDPDGVDATFPVTYQWFTTTDGGITKTPLTTDADGDSYTLQMDDSTVLDYGVTVRYTDISGKNEVVDALITLHPLIATGSGAVEENDQGADTGITLSAGNGYTIGGDAIFSVYGSDGQEDDRFEVVNEAGAWRLKLKPNTSLDAEEATRINLRIAHNNAAVVPVDVQIAVGDVDELNPDIAPETYPPRDGVVFYETVKIGTTIHEFEVIDDATAFDGLKVTFESTNRDFSEGNRFTLSKELRVDAATGKNRIFAKLELARELDYEEYTRLDARYSETVTVKVTGTSMLPNGTVRSSFVDFTFSIYILNINDTAPELELPDGTNSAVAQLDENIDGASVALNINFKASDLDDSFSFAAAHDGHNLPFTEFTFTISGDQAHRFEIVANHNEVYNWQLNLKSGESLDYERADTLNLQITASDGINTSAPLEITINVNDDASETNTHTPYFIGGAIALHVFEDIAVGVRIATLTALDGDASDTLTYSITAGNERGLFAIDANTGALSIAKTLDYEIAITHTLTVQVADGNGKSDRVEVVVNVLDVSPEAATPADTTPGVNDIIPIFTRAIGSPTYGVIDETDADGNAEDVSTGYKIRIIDADSNNNFTFDFNDDRFKFADQGEGIWELFLKAGSAVDYDMAGGESIALDFLINDGVNDAERRGAVQVRVNDYRRPRPEHYHIGDRAD